MLRALNVQLLLQLKSLKAQLKEKRSSLSRLVSDVTMPATDNSRRKAKLLEGLGAVVDSKFYNENSI